MAPELVFRRAARGVRGGDRRLRRRLGAHPRRLPPQPCQRRSRDPREDAHVAHDVPARRRRARRCRRGAAPRLRKKGEVGPAIERAGELIREALAESDRCELHLEDTAGAGGTLGRTFGELAELLNASGGGKRLGICLDSCHLLASGYDVRTIDGVDEVLERFDAEVGLKLLRSLHLNDSQQPLGSNRDRHASVAKGELGEEGCAAFLSAPAFDDLPCILETSADGDPPGGPAREQIELTTALRERGRKARRRRVSRSPKE